MISNVNPTADSRAFYRLIPRADWALLAILLLALVMRVGYLPVYGHSDLDVFYDWAVLIHRNSLFEIFRLETFYPYPPVFYINLEIANRIQPPIGMVIADDVRNDQSYLPLLKIFPILTELILIIAVYRWLSDQRRTRLLISLLLAVYPGLILVSAFWGQLDSPLVLFMALSLISLSRDRPIWSWVWFAVSLMTKFQGVVLAPVLIVLCLRRYGLRRTTLSMVVSGVVSLGLMLPFMLVSGVRETLAPFIGAVDLYPVTTGYAFNLWYANIPMVWGPRPPGVYDFVSDEQLIFGLISYKQVGLLLFGVFTLMICVNAWRKYHERREFVWMGALSFAFFMLPTQIHERYMHPAAIFLLLGAAQDRRLWVPALGLIFTYTYNLNMPIHAPFYWLGMNWMFIFDDISLHVALLNLVLFTWVTWVAVSRSYVGLASISQVSGTRFWIRLYNSLMIERQIRVKRTREWIIRAIGVSVIGLLVFAIVAHAAFPDRLPPDIQKLNVQLDNLAQLAGYQLHQAGGIWNIELYWIATSTITNDYKVFVHGVREGRTIAQCDELPQAGAYPTWRWFNNRLVRTTCALHFEQQFPPDTIYAGLYDPQTMRNVPVIQDGQPVADGRVNVMSLTDE